jgi:hypothetical protein
MTDILLAAILVSLWVQPVRKYLQFRKRRKRVLK